MSKRILYAGQSFLNKVVECTGDVDNALIMALTNRISISDDVLVGTELVPAPVTRQKVVDFFNELNRPATALQPEPIVINNQFGFPEGEFPISL